MSLADDFEKKLRTYDPQLRLRWGNAVKSWVIDRKAPMSKAERDLINFGSQHYSATPDDIEKERSAKLGCHMIACAKVLDNKILDDLMLHDLQRKGSGPNAQVRKVLESHEKRAAARRVEGHELARQTNDVLHWALNRQSSKIHVGRSDELIREGFGAPKPKGQQFGPPAPRKTPVLYDPFNRPLAS